MIVNVRVQRTPRIKRTYRTQPEQRAEYERQRQLGDALTHNATRRGDTSHIRSNDDYLKSDPNSPQLVCTKPEYGTYTGNALLGIATMHKSNPVPITREEGGIGTNPKLTGMKQVRGYEINPRSKNHGKQVEV